METLKACAIFYGAILISSMIVESFLPFSTTWENLQKQYPHLKSIQDKKDINSNRTLLLIMAALLSVIGLVYLSAKYKNEIVSFIFLPLAMLEITAGIKTLSNGVFSLPIGRNFAKYFYDEKNEYAWVAKSKIIFASIGSLMIAWKLIQYFFYS